MKKEIKNVAYESFKLYWMASHGYSIFDLTSELHKILEAFDWDNDRMPTKEELFSEFEEVGFNGEIYPCFEEFLNNEYLDKDIMREVLSDDDYNVYLKDINLTERN